MLKYAKLTRYCSLCHFHPLNQYSDLYITPFCRAMGSGLHHQGLRALSTATTFHEIY